MNKIPGPTGRMLVGAFFICLFIILSATAAPQSSKLPDLQKGLKEAKSSPIDNTHREWGIGQLHPPDLTPGLLPSEEKIALNESDSRKQVSDLTAMNAAKERDIVYDGMQYRDLKSQNLVNSLDVAVTGQEDTANAFSSEKWDDSNIDKIVDNALNSSMENGRPARGSALAEPLGNNLKIDVSGISVRAINTVPGGSAVATSNIIIKPVQIIVCPSEVEEKLK